MLQEIINDIDKKFYYGCGGIGDFLLLMSTFYDNIDNNEVDVVFAANNCNSILNFSKLFPKVRLFRIYPLRGHNKLDWDYLQNNVNLLGTSVTPKNFDYIGDWVECGKSNVFDYYGIPKDGVKWSEYPFSNIEKKHLITIHPHGGKDSNRISLMSNDYIQNLINTWDGEIVFIGSNADKLKFNYLGYDWATNFDDAIRAILSSERLYSVNTWGKTLSGLFKVPTTIFRSSYVNDPEVVYGHYKDPSDYVFLDNWGFDFAKD